jgi:CHAD domain-containing protein
MPNLAAAIPGAETRPLPRLALRTTYYDTADFRLARRHLALRHRCEQPVGLPTGAPGGAPLELGRLHAVVPQLAGPAEPRCVWTLKLPPEVDGAVLARREVTWPSPLCADASGVATALPALIAEDQLRAPSAPGGSAGLPAPEPPWEVRKFLSALCLGRLLQPIARLKTDRRRTAVLMDGQPVAEIDEDDVEGSVAVEPAEAPASVLAWKEIEVEAARGAATTHLAEIVRALVASGARPSLNKSKLGTVLGSAGLPRAEERLPNVNTSTLEAKGTLADVLQVQAKACLGTLVEHDLPIRLGDPDLEHVHKARVATRRFRSLLWALRRLRLEALDRPRPARPGTGAPAPSRGAGHEAAGGGSYEDVAVPALGWVRALRSELRWLGAALGGARDADVRLATLSSECARLNSVDQPAAAAVLEAARSDQTIAHQVLLEVMGSERYLAVLRSLEALATGAGRPRTSPVRGRGPAGRRGAPGAGGGDEQEVGGAAGVPGAGGGDEPGVLSSPGPGEPEVGGAAGTPAGETPPLGPAQDGTGAGPAPGVGPPPAELWHQLEVPAVKAMAQLGAAQWRSARRAERRLGPSPSDEALHRLRIQTKRLRYIAEAAAPVARDKARRRAALHTVSAATALQDVLGELHDSVVRERWLRDLVSRSPSGDWGTAQVAFVAGELAAGCRARADQIRSSWAREWRRLDRKALATWAT